jgi:putative component of toxin-antitoxin plasmid stabilization module
VNSGVKALDHGLFELRDRSTGIRIFYVFEGHRRIVLLGGIVKKRDDIPARTLRRLQAWQQELEAGKGR